MAEPRITEEMLAIEVSQVKPSVLFLVAGQDGIVFSCREKLMVRPHDEESARWIKFTLGKLGLPHE
jgi:hypothetical protein